MQGSEGIYVGSLSLEQNALWWQGARRGAESVAQVGLAENPEAEVRPSPRPLKLLRVP